MAENVGGIYYDVTLETAGLIQGQRTVDRATKQAASSFDRVTAASKGFTDANGRMREANGRFVAGARDVVGANASIAASLDNVRGRLTATAGAAKILVATLITVAFVKAADELRLLQARVDVATGSIEAGAAAMAQLEDISRRTNSALSSNVQVFTRLNGSIKQMGGTEADTLRTTELLAKAITVSGASAQEKTSAMIQFGQALGSGKLAGDELRSLLENAPYLMQKLAAGIGVPVGALKGLGEQGKLTSDVVVKALSSAAAQIDADFARFPKTFDASMTQVADAARRGAGVLDEVSGASATMTGIVSGAAKALDDLVAAFGGVDRAGAKLAREKLIEEWSRTTRNALSYVADAADVTWTALSALGRNVAFVIGGIGREIGGIGAQVAAVLRGDFAGARAIGEDMRADAERRRKELDEADARALASRKTWGEQMRAAAAQASIEDRGFRPTAAPSKLKAPVDPEEARKLAARRAAAQAYYEGLLADTRTGLAKIDAEEQKALAENERRMKSDEKNADIYQRAKLLITQKFARERVLFEEDRTQEAAAINIAITRDETAKIEAIRTEAYRRADKLRELGLKSEQEAARLKVLAAFQAEEALRALENERAQTSIVTLEMRAQRTGGNDDAEAAIRARAAEDLRLNFQKAMDDDIANWEMYAARRVEIQSTMEQQIADLRAQANAAALGSMSAALGQMTDVLRNSAGEQDGIYKALFAAQKAFAIASSVVAIQTGIANASKLTWPANLAAMASVIAATANIVTTIRGTSYGGGRQYGGPVDSGGLYRVNETGKPEMFTGANGAQFMLATQRGSVTAADKIGGSGTQVNVHNYAGADVQVSGSSDGRVIDIAVRRAKAEIASEISSNSGQTWSALRGGSNIQPRL